MKLSVTFVLILTSVRAEGIRNPLSAILPPKDDRPKVLLQGLDLLALPDEEVELTATLERRRGSTFFMPVAGETIHFFLKGRRVGTARTSAIGKAVLPYRFEKAGDFTIRISFSKRSAESAGSGGIFVRVAESDTRYVLTDIEKTLHSQNAVRFPFIPNRNIPSLTGARKALQKFAGIRSILYLSSGDGRAAGKVRTWLDSYGFPGGPVFHLSLPHDPEAAARRKMEQFGRIRRRFPNLLAGIGNRRSDAIACQENQMASFLIMPVPEKNLPTGTHAYPSWEHLYKALFFK